MPAADPFLLAASIAIGCAALGAVRPILAAHLEARAAARASRERSRRMHAEIEARLEALRADQGA